MAWTRPTLSELVDRVGQDFVSRLALDGSPLRRSLINVLIRVLAGMAHMLYGALEFLAQQLFPDTSVSEFLFRQASIFGVTQTPATYATGTATVTGTNGTVISTGSVLVRSDGVEYTVDADVTVALGTATLALTASTAGADPTLEAGVVLSFESPITNVSATATVTASTEDGNDLESERSLRDRFLDKLQNPPQGGALADYEQWAKEVSGVTRAWVKPRQLGAGTVVVYFVRDNDVDMIPDSGEVATVQDYLDTKRPVTAAVTVLAPVEAPVNFTLHVVPNTVAVQTAVTAELTDLFSRVGEPGGSVLLSEIRTAIGIAEGLTDYTLTTPSADVTNVTGDISTLGTVNYV